MQLLSGCTELLVDCLLVLPSLHMLEIMDDNYTRPWTIKIVFENEPNFPDIKKAAIPICTGPMLSQLPNLEELTFYCKHVKGLAFKKIPSSL